MFRKFGATAASIQRVSTGLVFALVIPTAQARGDGLRGWWRLDEGAGDVAHDTSGKGHHGHIFGNADWIPGECGSALRFDGIDDYVEVPNSTDWAFPDGITLVAWVRFTEYNHDVTIVGNHISGQNTGYFIGVREDHFRFLIAQTSYNSIETDDTYRDGVWHHVVGIFDTIGNLQRLYVDGELEAEQITIGPYPDESPANLRIGAYTEGQYAEKFRGDIDEVKIYDYPISEPGTAVALDIKPGSCPNPFNRRSRGILPVGLLGTACFDVTQVDLSTLALSRGDGVGGSVAPLEGPPGPHSVIEDVGTPFDGEPCDCHDLTGDGIVDLSMKFKTQQVVDELELNGLDAGAVVELIVSGSLLDGTPFEASDCIEIVPAPGVGAVNVSVGSNQPDTYIEVTPSDATTDDSGFTPFNRCYENGTTVSLTAPASSNRRVFSGWRVNGVPQASSQRTIQAVADGIVSLEAVYGSRRSSRLPVAAYDE